jgi:hypothetical protein
LLLQKFDHNISFWEKRHFDNWQKSLKLVIITSTPGLPAKRVSDVFSGQTLSALPLIAILKIF